MFTFGRYGSPHGSIIFSPKKLAGVSRPLPGPGAPAGDSSSTTLTSLLGLVVKHERRRGRGAPSNACGRYEPLARIAFDDGWQDARRATAVQDHGHDRRNAQDHHPQRIARHRLRPLDQSLSRLRARLHLLLRAPDPRLSRAFGRLDFESKLFVKPDAPLLERELSAPNTRRARSRSAPIPTPISRSSGSIRSCAGSWKCWNARPPGRHRHQIGAGPARPRYSGAHGGTQSRQGRAVGDHARRELARVMEPRAATPRRRLEALRALTEAGVPTTVMVAP